MKFTSILNLLLALASSGEISRVDAAENVEQPVVPQDSLKNNENVLNIQDDFPVYENFQYITQEKTVYVTLTPPTVFVTVTKTVEIPSTVSNTVKITKTLNATPAITSKPVEYISSVIIVETKTDITTSLTTTYVEPSDTIAFTTLPSNSSTTLESQLYDSPPVPYPTSSSFLEVVPGAGELDMILGDRKNFKDSTSTGSIVTSPVSSSSSTDVKYISETPTPIQIATPTKSLSKTSNSTLLDNAFDPFSNVIITGTTTTNSPSTTSANYSKSIYNSFNGTHTTTFNNMTGLEQLLENFSPYSNLPTADYELSNNGNRLAVAGWFGASICCILGYVM